MLVTVNKQVDTGTLPGPQVNQAKSQVAHESQSRRGPGAEGLASLVHLLAVSHTMPQFMCAQLYRFMTLVFRFN